MKMFYIWITMRCYYVFLSIDVSVFFTRYSLRHLPLKLFISSIKLLSLYKVYMAFAFAQKYSARPRKANNGHRPFSEAIWQ